MTAPVSTASASRTTTPPLRVLFLTFLEMALSGFGGVLPFARRVLVEKRGWLTEAGFNETLALCQSLPGPNIVNMSIVVGSRFAGARGALACVSGLVAAPVAVVLILADLWGRFGAVGHLPAMIRCLGAAAAGLVAATALRMARPVLGFATGGGAPAAAALVMATVFVAIGIERAPLPWVLLALAPLSVLLAWRRLR